jgi:hypothetical protein
VFVQSSPPEDDIDEVIEEHGGWPLDAAGAASPTP